MKSWDNNVNNINNPASVDKASLANSSLSFCAASFFVYNGTNARLNAPSAKNLRNRFGSENAA